ncbi:MAG: proton-conducting transporter membrane subunit [Planctomycetota bacterium]
MNTIVIAPVLAALAAGTVALIGGARLQRGVLVVGALLHFGFAAALFSQVAQHGVLALHVGGWVAPLGIALVADSFAAVMVLLCGLLGFATSMQIARATPEDDLRSGVPAMTLFLLAGVDAAFLAADLFHLYVAFEVLLLASFTLLVAGKGAARRTAAIRSLMPGVLSSMLLLGGVGLLYGMTGTLFMPDAGAILAERGNDPAVRAVAGLLALAFALKAAVFPVYAWLPTSYPAAPSEIVALFAGLLTKVGVYALVRVFTLVLPNEMSWLGPIVLGIACLTMVIGVLGALAQWEMRGLLSFHVVSQVGYLVIGLGLGTKAALAATVYYLFHNSVAKTGLLLATGVVESRRGTGALKRLGGLAGTDPWLAGLFLVAAFALAGIPPLSGFWAKLLVLRSALDDHAWIVLAVAASVGALTLLSMAKIWTNAFWGSVPADAPAPRRSVLELAPLAMLVAVAVALGLFAGPAIEFAERAAAELLDPSGYRAALGGGRG